MEFSLFSELAELGVREWLMFGAAAAVFAAALVLLARRARLSVKSSGIDTESLVTGGMCVALSFVLSYIRLFKMPQGGSITPASMLPVMLYAYCYGPKKGFLAAFCYSFLAMIQDMFFVAPMQIVMDYTLAFTSLGLTAFFAKREMLVTGVITAGAARIFWHFLAGVIFFKEYAPEGMNVAIYSIGYQLATLLPDITICAVAAFALRKNAAFEKLMKSRSGHKGAGAARSAA